MEEMLEDLGLLYKALMDSAADAIIVINEQGNILHFSRSAEQLFGYPAQECIGENVRLLMPEPYRSEHDSHLQNYQQTGKAGIIGKGRDVSGKKKDGSVFPMHLSVGKARIRQQLCYIGICHDLSEYKKTLSEKLHIESLQNALFDAAVDGIITINNSGVIYSFNRAAEQLFGYNKDEVIGQNITLLMPSPYHETHDGYLSRFLHTGQAQIIGTGRDVPGLKKDGTIFPMRLSVGKAVTGNNETFIGVCHDLTDYQNALLELAKAEQRYKSIVECQGQIICRLDNELKLTFANQAFQRIFECSEKEILGMHFINFIPGDKHEMQQVLLETLHGQPDQQTHYKTLMLRKSGKFNIEWWFTKVPDNNGLNEIQGFGIDISEKEEAIRKASFLKNHDALTGLLKPDAFSAAAQNWITSERYALLYTDCNHFRLINNHYGFEVGDKMLLEAARRLRKSISKPALFCRSGGDELVALVEISQTSDASALAENLLRCLNLPYVINDEEIRVSCKIGIALYPDNTEQISIAIRQAESALPLARNSRNNIAFYDQAVHSSLQRQLDVEQRLRIAIEEKLLQVHLQPKVDMQTKQTIGYEALLRWFDPVLGFVSPAEFIAIAESTALAPQIDRLVLDIVFSRIQQCKDNGMPVLPVAVNITSRHFYDPALALYVISLAEKYHVCLGSIELEVTEGVFLENSNQVQLNLKRLRSRGVKVSVDDFGTGYSSLSYIKKLSIDALKIDKSFVDDIADETGQQLIAAVLAIAKAVGLAVIAEGVETEQQRDILLKLGCNIGQGYLFAKPQFIDTVLFGQTADTP